MGEPILPTMPAPDEAMLRALSAFDAVLEVAADVENVELGRVRAVLDMTSALAFVSGQATLAIPMYDTLLTTLTPDTELGLGQVRAAMDSATDLRAYRSRLMGLASRLAERIEESADPEWAQTAASHLREQLVTTETTTQRLTELEDDILDVLVVIEARAMQREGEIDDEIVADHDVDRALAHA